VNQAEIQSEVRQFYDQIGWQSVGEGVYQNARYEDLRVVSREYIHQCHVRVKHHLKSSGKYLLDAGSGPIQYPEYLTYSENYDFRVCLDLSRVALVEAQQRLGDKGLYVVADVSKLPFKSDVFDAVVSLHTLHHLNLAAQRRSYLELHRCMAPATSGVLVNGWTHSVLMSRLKWLVSFMEWFGRLIVRLRGKARDLPRTPQPSQAANPAQPTGTFIEKLDYAWIEQEIAPHMRIELRVWRSVSVRFLRAVIHQPYGKWLLRFLYWWEERLPRWMGRIGQYPLLVIYKD